MSAGSTELALDPARATACKGHGMAAPQRAHHMAGMDDALVSVRPLRDRVANFAELLNADPDDPELNALWRNELIGRPLGDEAFSTRSASNSIAP